MSRNHCIEDSEIAELFDEECGRYYPSKPCVPNGSLTCIDHDTFSDSEEEAFVSIWTRSDSRVVLDDPLLDRAESARTARRYR